MKEEQQFLFWTIWDFRVQLAKRTKLTPDHYKLIARLKVLHQELFGEKSIASLCFGKV